MYNSYAEIPNQKLAHFSSFPFISQISLNINNLCHKYIVNAHIIQQRDCKTSKTKSKIIKQWRALACSLFQQIKFKSFLDCPVVIFQENKRKKKPNKNKRKTGLLLTIFSRSFNLILLLCVRHTRVRASSTHTNTNIHRI